MAAVIVYIETGLCTGQHPHIWCWAHYITFQWLTCLSSVVVVMICEGRYILKVNRMGGLSQGPQDILRHRGPVKKMPEGPT